MRILTLCLLLFSVGCTIDTPQTPDKTPPVVIPEEDIIPDDEVVSPEDNSIFHKFEGEALILMNNMSIEEKIGQMFLARCPEDENLSLYLSMTPGGFIMFGRDFTDKTKEEVINNNNYYQENSDIPMIIGIDAGS